MTTNSREKDLPTKQEAPATSSRLWPGLKNPRIVRVSRAFGGKDRHSKVSTIRGLRDRRVRLSVPTAIQLYDLQDRLGVNQPSKVVDWLLNAAHQEIDKLPPLQLPPGNLVQYIPQSLSQYSHEAAAALSQNPSQYPPLVAENFEYTNGNEHEPRVTTLPQSTYWSSDVIPQRSKHNREDQEDGHTDEKGNTNADVLPKLAGPSLVSMAPYSSYYHWEATNAYLSQFGIRPSEAPPAPDTQIVLCPQGPSSMFPSYFSEQFIQTQTANSAQSNSAKNSLHFGGTPARPFQ